MPPRLSWPTAGVCCNDEDYLSNRSFLTLVEIADFPFSVLHICSLQKYTPPARWDLHAMPNDYPKRICLSLASLPFLKTVIDAEIISHVTDVVGPDEEITANDESHAAQVPKITQAYAANDMAKDIID